MSEEQSMHQLDKLRGEWYGHETMKWYGWGSPVGLALFFGILMVSTSLMLYLLHLAGIMN